MWMEQISDLSIMNLTTLVILSKKDYSLRKKQIKSVFSLLTSEFISVVANNLDGVIVMENFVVPFSLDYL